MGIGLPPSRVHSSAGDLAGLDLPNARPVDTRKLEPLPPLKLPVAAATTKKPDIPDTGETVATATTTAAGAIKLGDDGKSEISKAVSELKATIADLQQQVQQLSQKPVVVQGHWVPNGGPSPHAHPQQAHNSGSPATPGPLKRIASAIKNGFPSAVVLGGSVLAGLVAGHIAGGVASILLGPALGGLVGIAVGATVAHKLIQMARQHAEQSQAGNGGYNVNEEPANQPTAPASTHAPAISHQQVHKPFSQALDHR